MRTKRLVMAGVVAMALAGGASTALASAGGAAQPAGTAADAATTAVTAGSGDTAPAAPASAGPRVVRPYEPVEIGQGAVMGLLPQGRQNYVVAWQNFDEYVEQAKGYVGDSIRPNSLSGGLHVDGDDVLFTGAFRTDTVPARITVRVGTGAEKDAGMLTLPGDPGWGTYHLDAAGTGAPRQTTRVTAYGEDGAVLASLTFEPSTAGR